MHFYSSCLCKRGIAGSFILLNAVVQKFVGYGLKGNPHMKIWIFRSVEKKWTVGGGEGAARITVCCTVVLWSKHTFFS